MYVLIGNVICALFGFIQGGNKVAARVFTVRSQVDCHCCLQSARKSEDASNDLLSLSGYFLSECCGSKFFLLFPLPPLYRKAE